MAGAFDLLLRHRVSIGFPESRYQHPSWEYYSGWRNTPPIALRLYMKPVNSKSDSTKWVAASDQGVLRRKVSPWSSTIGSRPAASAAVEDTNGYYRSGCTVCQPWLAAGGAVADSSRPIPLAAPVTTATSFLKFSRSTSYAVTTAAVDTKRPSFMLP